MALIDGLMIDGLAHGDLQALLKAPVEIKASSAPVSEKPVPHSFNERVFDVLSRFVTITPVSEAQKVEINDSSDPRLKQINDIISFLMDRINQDVRP